MVTHVEAAQSLLRYDTWKDCTVTVDLPDRDLQVGRFILRSLS